MTNKPTVIIVVGMAGSGKTTFFNRLNLFFNTKTQKRVFTMNLDPAVTNSTLPVHLDIRDSVVYEDVMKNYKLGPNGGILTSMNIFATQFHSVLETLENRADEFDYILIDTPGQIEVFNWSASGTIITESLGLSFPTVFCYLCDTVSCVEYPISFMSNMLYCCSIQQKSELPFFIAFNKTDAADYSVCQDWMCDSDSIRNALTTSDAQESTYQTVLAKSMALLLDDFYKNMPRVGVSSATGAGFDEFPEILDRMTDDYHKVYLPRLLAKREKNRIQRESNVVKQAERDEDAEEFEKLQALLGKK